MMGFWGWQWHQLDHKQTICTSIQTDNHNNTSSVNFYRPDALPLPNQQCQSTQGKLYNDMANKPPQPRKTNQSDHINLDVVGGGDWTGPALVTAAADDGTADDDNDDDASFDLSTDAE